MVKRFIKALYILENLSIVSAKEGKNQQGLNFKYQSICAFSEQNSTQVLFYCVCVFGA